MTQYLLTILFTAAVTLALSWVVWKLALRFKLYPGIRDRDVHKTPTPRLGGVAMFLGVVAAFALSSRNPYFSIFWTDPVPVLWLLGAVLLIVLVGVADDLWDLDWMIKLGAQFIAAGIIAWFGQLQILSLPIGALTVGSSWVSFLLTVFALVVVMNAVNFIDGLNGLVAGVCLIANGVFFAYSYLLVRDTGASTYFNLASFIAAVLVGACLGFLPMNWTPAKLFMGDAGALMLGLLMASSAIAITGQLDPAVLDPEKIEAVAVAGCVHPDPAAVVIVLLPLLDFGLAVIRRQWAGRSPFSPDRKHLHHRMLDMGHTDTGAVLIFYSWTAVVSLAFLLMYIGTQQSWPGDYLFGILFGIVGVIACAVLTFLPSPHRLRRLSSRRARPTPPESSS
ncbi:MAG: MraY family glycosyltransferase [Microbacterium enclense]